MIPLSPTRSSRSETPNKPTTGFKSFLCVLDAQSPSIESENRGISKHPAFDRHQWSIDQNSVKVHDLTTDDRSRQSMPIIFHFDQIFNGSNEFHASSYYVAVAPLVRKVLAGDDAMTIMCGPASADFSSYMLSQQSLGSNTSSPGLITQAASQLLLASTTTSGEKKASLTLSWYRIECSPSESIVDILRVASDIKSGNPSNISTEQLVMREQGRGRGMAIPGLWEVEITTTADIEAVIAHVLNIVPLANHSSGSAHTVFQLAYSSVTNSVCTTSRLSLVILSDLSPPSTSSTESIVTKEKLFPWIQQLLVVMDWLEHKHAAPPFHKSRALLLLRDVLLNRQAGCLLLLTHQPNVKLLPKVKQWLQIANRMRQEPLQENKNISLIPSEEASYPVLEDLYHSNTSQRAISPNVRINTSVPAINRSMLNTPQPQQPPRPQSPAFFGNSSLAAIFGSVDQNQTESNTNINRVSAPTVRSRSVSPRSQSPRPKSPQHGKKVSLREALKSVTATDRSLLSIHAQLKRDDNNISGISYIQYEEANLIKAAFEAMQHENQDLRHQLAKMESECLDHKENYFNLIEQLKEEGAMLEKKDQDRLKKALQDIRDYELYKEVMEATMVRMSNELNDLSKDNQELKQQKSIADVAARKHKAFDERYSRDLTATKKKLCEAESKIQQLLNEIRLVTKDRETAVSDLLSLKADIKKHSFGNGKLMDGSLAENKKISSNTQEAPLSDGDRGKGKVSSSVSDDERQKLLKRIEELEIELAATETVHKQDVASLKAAHTLALEQVMQYQEENRKLKSTVGAMLDAVDGAPQQIMIARPSSRSNKSSADRSMGVNTTGKSNTDGGPLPKRRSSTYL